MAAGRGLELIASRVETVTRKGIADSRQLSRIAALSRLRAEAASIGFELARAGTIAQAEVVRDLARAKQAAERYAKRWLANAAGETARAAVAAANAATQGSLRRIAVTESAEAFNTGRAKLIRIIRRRELWRVWDAELDRRTCSICEGADGTVVGAVENFPDGEPGAVHPWCRCSWTLVTAEEIDSTDIAA